MLKQYAESITWQTQAQQATTDGHMGLYASAVCLASKWYLRLDVLQWKFTSHHISISRVRVSKEVATTLQIHHFLISQTKERAEGHNM